MRFLSFFLSLFSFFFFFLVVMVVVVAQQGIKFREQSDLS